MSILKSVDMRTNLAGENRMELLVFYLSSKQAYGINVFKVKEVYLNPKITVIPGSHPSCIGVTYFRGRTIPVIDLAKAMDLPPLPENDKVTTITTEYNRSMQGLLVSSVDRIINTSWDSIQIPPAGTGAGSGSYITSITQIDGQLIEIIDVEMILEKINPRSDTVSAEVLKDDVLQSIDNCNKEVLIVDDSSVARRKIQATLKQLGLEVKVAKTGREAYDILKSDIVEGEDINDKYLMIISDIEMPEMDGYSLVSSIRADQHLKSLYVAMHSSMSGEFNEELVSKVGADVFVPKFNPDEFAEMVQNRIVATQKK